MKDLVKIVLEAHGDVPVSMSGNVDINDPAIRGAITNLLSSLRPQSKLLPLDREQVYYHLAEGRSELWFSLRYEGMDSRTLAAYKAGLTRLLKSKRGKVTKLPIYGTRVAAQIAGVPLNVFKFLVYKEPLIAARSIKSGRIRFYPQLLLDYIAEKYGKSGTETKDVLTKEEILQSYPFTLRMLDYYIRDEQIPVVRSSGEAQPYIPRKGLMAFLLTHKRTSTKWVRVEDPRDSFIHDPFYPDSRDLDQLIAQLAEKELNHTEIAKKLRVDDATVTRRLNNLGILTARAVKRDYPTIDDVRNARFEELFGYFDEAKTRIHDRMLDTALEYLKVSGPIRYVGLESPNFRSYLRVAEKFDINKRKSLIPEIDRKGYFLMSSFVKHSKYIKGGEPLRGLRLFRGDVLTALKRAKKGLDFDFVNLDYQGPLSPDKLTVIEELFYRGRISEGAILFITINNSPQSIGKLTRGSCQLDPKYLENIVDKSNQREILNKNIYRIAKRAGRQIEEVVMESYTGRVSKETNMLFFGYKVT